jgi:Cu2+-exporting ATPase
MFAAAAMSLSSFCVVTNALRLNMVRIYDTKHDKKVRQKNNSGTGRTQKEQSDDLAQTGQERKQLKQDITNAKETKNMKKTMNIEGMMCGHCEARVKKALEALAEVEEAVVSHVSGTAVVTLNAEIADEQLKSAVEAQDYKVTGIQ